VNALELLVGHWNQGVPGPHPVGATVIPSGSGRPRRDMYDEHTPALGPDLLQGDPAPDPLVDPRLGATRLGECGGADHLPRTIIGHAQNELAAPFVRYPDTIPHQFVEVVAVPRFLALDACALRRREQCGELFRRGHLGGSPRAT